MLPTPPISKILDNILNDKIYQSRPNATYATSMIAAFVQQRERDAEASVGVATGFDLLEVKTQGFQSRIIAFFW
ncbi:hypothetical protein BDV26DRAFT_293886 [Aspergillus bertholletiae]|uniref:Uncharacterized protein n=1 Tax=Aspergillus bertholletiae TaxID=1226010 RepID=A0A5N7B3R7_9EURO|nr:hypothetical protein BDV26DRAFT_293886 [Aspergillus bertholletiae]